MPIPLQDNIFIEAPKPAEPKSLSANNQRYSSVQEFLDRIPLAYRHDTLQFWVNNDLYWLDGDLENPVLRFQNFSGTINTIEVLSQASTLLAQEPTTLDTPLQINLGPAINPGLGLSLDSLGTITVETTAWYEVHVNASFGRVGTTGQSVLVGWYEISIDGGLSWLKVGDSIHARLTTDEDNLPLTLTQKAYLEVGMKLRWMIMRDSSGDNSGGLYQLDPVLAGIPTSPTASIAMYRQEAVFEGVVLPVILEGVQDAPNDGVHYIRKFNEWVEGVTRNVFDIVVSNLEALIAERVLDIPAGAGDKTYVRKNTSPPTWEEAIQVASYTPRLGAIWTTYVTNLTRTTTGGCYHNGLFYLSCDTAGFGIYTTPDGVNYTPVATPTGNTTVWYDVCGANTTMIAVGKNSTNRVMRSTDHGKTWNYITGSPDTDGKNWRRVATDGDGTWVAGAMQGAGTDNIMVSHDDGLTWARKTLPLSTNITDVIYADNVWYATEYNATGGVLRSLDNGETWQSVLSVGVTLPYTIGLEYVNGRIFAISQNPGTGSNCLAYSYNKGTTWSYVNNVPLNGDSWLALRYGDGKLVLQNGGGTKYVYSDDDGQTWKLSTTSLAITGPYKLLYGNGLMIGKQVSGQNAFVSGQLIENTLPLPIPTAGSGIPEAPTTPNTIFGRSGENEDWTEAVPVVLTKDLTIDLGEFNLNETKTTTDYTYNEWKYEGGIEREITENATQTKLVEEIAYNYKREYVSYNDGVTQFDNYRQIEQNKIEDTVVVNDENFTRSKLDGTGAELSISQTSPSVFHRAKVALAGFFFTKGFIDNAPTENSSPIGKKLLVRDATTGEIQSIDVTNLGLGNPLFKGVFVSLVALQTAYPTATSGDYAYVDTGVGQDIQTYVWDNNDSSWVLQVGGGGGISDAPNDSTPYVRQSLGWVQGVLKSVYDAFEIAATNAFYTINLKLSKYPEEATLGKVLVGDGTNYVEVDIPTGITNLSIANKTATSLDVISSTGTDATIPSANATEAGLQSSNDKTKLDKYPSTATNSKFLKGNGTTYIEGDVNWNDVQNKPTTFDPSAHTHTISDVTNLQDVLNEKENKSNIYQSVSSVSGVLTLNYNTSKNWRVALTENIASMIITNLPDGGEMNLQLTQNSVAPYYTVMLPAFTKVSNYGQETILMSNYNNAVDFVAFKKVGTTLYADHFPAYN